MLSLEAIKRGVDPELLAWELLPSQSLFSQGTSVPVPSERGLSTEGTADSSEEPLPPQGSYPLCLSCCVKLRAAESWAPNAFSCEGEFAEIQNDLSLNPGSPRMLRTTPSLLSLAPGPILAVEFFASQKPLWEPPVVSTPRLKRQASVVVSPAPTEQARDSLGAGQERQSSVCTDGHSAVEGARPPPVLRPDMCRPLI